MLSLQNFTKNISHGWGDLFVRRSIVTSAVEFDNVTSSGFYGYNIPQPDDRDGSISLSKVRYSSQ